MKSSRLAYRCMLAVSQLIWFYENAGKTKQVLSARHAVMERFKILEISRKVKSIEMLYQRVILSTSLIAQIKRTMLRT